MLKSLAGGAFFGEIWGEGRPEILALHGWGRTHTDFAAVLGPRSPQGALPTLAPDLPGFGATPAPPTPWGAADYAAALVPLIEDQGPLVVLGHSRGGCIAVALAAARPELVRGLVLTGAPLLPRPGGGRRPAAGFRLARRLHRLGLLSEARMEEARQRHGSTDYKAATGIMRDVFVRMVNERYDDELKALAGPVELVWGDDDAEVPVEVAQSVLALLPAAPPAPAAPAATLTLCPGAGHLTPLSAPAELRAAVERVRGERLPGNS